MGFVERAVILAGGAWDTTGAVYNGFAKTTHARWGHCDY